MSGVANFSREPTTLSAPETALEMELLFLFSLSSKILFFEVCFPLWSVYICS